MDINPFAKQRAELGLSQHAIAKRLDVTDKCVSSWERGQTTPRPKIYDAVATAYEVTAETVALWVMEVRRCVASRTKTPAGAAA